MHQIVSYDLHKWHMKDIGQLWASHHNKMKHETLLQKISLTSNKTYTMIPSILTSHGKKTPIETKVARYNRKIVAKFHIL